MLKPVFLANFEIMVTPLGPSKIPKCLENGPLWDRNGSKIGQKRVCPKVILDQLRCSNKLF